MTSAREALEWLSEREKVLLRPDAYIGNVTPHRSACFLADSDPSTGQVSLEVLECDVHPGILKLFDEVAVNCLDAASRDSKVRNVRFSLDDDGRIKATNDGSGMAVEMYRDTGRYGPSVAFSEFHSSTNFNDGEERTTGGRNGVGVKICGVFSHSFSVEVVDPERGLQFTQEFHENLSKPGKEIVRNTKIKTGKVSVQFLPDYERLGLRWSARSHAASILRRHLLTRAVEVQVCIRKGVKVQFEATGVTNAQLQKCTTAKDLCALMFPGAEVLQTDGDNYAVAVVLHEEPKDQSSLAFVNGIRCPGGTHVKHVQDKINALLMEGARSHTKRPEMPVRPQQAREMYAFVLVCTVINPVFTSQDKSTLSTPVRSFGGSPLVFPAAFEKKIRTSGSAQQLGILCQNRENSLLSKSTTTKGSGSRKVPQVDKYDTALYAGSNKSKECTLILTEGDSAKALAVAGVSVVGRERYGIFPLRGVPLNCRNTALKKALENKEICGILKILNVAAGQQTSANIRYGKVALLTDQDPDGTHIGALVINALQCLVPFVLRENPNFICRIVTPLVKVSVPGNADLLEFFSAQEFKAWEASTQVPKYQSKYYKGLGTSTHKEAKETFKKLDERLTDVAFTGDACGAALDAFFSDKMVDTRKSLLTDGYNGDAHVDWREPRVSVKDFLYNELVHFSKYDVFRSLPSCLDGLKPSQRKCLFYLLKQKPGVEVKVAQAAAGTAQLTHYHHGEESLVEAIVGMAQDHVGANNVALFDPIGQFGTRTDKPSVHAASRYIFTRASSIARYIFREEDADLLDYVEEEGNSVEPVWYLPVIPVILLNGAAGIGTGFATSVPPHGIDALVGACLRCAQGGPAGDHEGAYADVVPEFYGFEGKVQKADKGWSTVGNFVRTDDTSLTITELPIGKWTDNYLKDLKTRDEKAKPDHKLPPTVSIFNESTESNIRIRVTFPAKICALTDEEIEKELKLTSLRPTSYMYLFDTSGSLRQFEDVPKIGAEHARVRLAAYERRRALLIEQGNADLKRIDQKIAFVSALLTRRLDIVGRKRGDIESSMQEIGIERLADVGYDSLFAMNVLAVTSEKIEGLKEARELKSVSVLELEKTTAGEMWEKELEELRPMIKKHYDDRDARYAETGGPSAASGGRPAKRAKPGNAKKKV